MLVLFSSSNIEPKLSYFSIAVYQPAVKLPSEISHLLVVAYSVNRTAAVNHLQETNQNFIL